MFAFSPDPLDIEILIIPDATLILTAAVLEPLRAANRILGRRQYRWIISTPDGLPVMTTSGIPIPADRRFRADSGREPIIVVASYNLSHHATPPLIHRLAALSRHRPAIGGVESGVILLAQAGLLDGRAATAHWEDLDDFAARFANVEVRPDRFVIDGTRFTAGGASPALDLMLELIRRRQGYPLALDVSKLFIYDQTRADEPGMSPPSLGRLITRDPRVARAVQVMEAHIEDSLSIDNVARIVGVSARRLQSLFRDVLGVTPKDYYQALRLNVARRLMIETSRPATEIAERAGFPTLSGFSRAYSQRYGESPRATRRRARAAT